MNELTNIPGDIAAALEAGERLGETRIEMIDDTPLALSHHGLTALSLEQFLARPTRIQAAISVSTAESFTDYFNRFANEDSTVFCDIKNGTFKGEIDYHGPDSPARRDHAVIFQVDKTPEWDAWMNSSGNKMRQIEFARHIEDNIDEIIDPDGATMLEIAQSLQVKNNSQFTSGLRLDNGQVQLQYIEEIKGTAGVKGQITIPQEIQLGIVPFRDADPYRVTAKFRYRMTSGQLLMWYDLQRPHRVFESAIADVTKTIKANIGDSPFINV